MCSVSLSTLRFLTFSKNFEQNVCMRSPAANRKTFCKLSKCSLILCSAKNVSNAKRLAVDIRGFIVLSKHMWKIPLKCTGKSTVEHNLDLYRITRKLVNFVKKKPL